jgi:hypothetical protein
MNKKKHPFNLNRLQHMCASQSWVWSSRLLWITPIIWHICCIVKQETVLIICSLSRPQSKYITLLAVLYSYNAIARPCDQSSPAGFCAWSQSIRRWVHHVINEMLHPNLMCQQHIEGLQCCNIIGGGSRCQCPIICLIRLAPAMSNAERAWSSWSNICLLSYRAWGCLPSD